MAQRDQHPELAKFLDELGIGHELEPVSAYMLGVCTSSKSPDLNALAAGVIALLVEAHPEVGVSLHVPRFSELLHSLWDAALKIRDAGMAHDFGLGLDAELTSQAEVVAAGEGLSSCLYCFLRGLKDGVGSLPVILNSFTLKQLNELEGVSCPGSFDS